MSKTFCSALVRSSARGAICNTKLVHQEVAKRFPQRLGKANQKLSPASCPFLPAGHPDQVTVTSIGFSLRHIARPYPPYLSTRSSSAVLPSFSGKKPLQSAIARTIRLSSFVSRPVSICRWTAVKMKGVRACQIRWNKSYSLACRGPVILRACRALTLYRAIVAGALGVLSSPHGSEWRTRRGQLDHRCRGACLFQ